MHRKIAAVVSPGLLVLALSACGGGGSGTASAPSPAPTASLSASAADVKTNDAVTLTWSSTNASTCTASGGGWSGSLAASGSQSQPVASSTTFTVNCTGSGGNTSSSTTVTAWNAPVPTVSTDVSSVLPNNTVTVTWSSQNARSCAGADGLSGTLPLSGTQASPSLAATTLLSVSCSNPVYAAVKASANVTVTPTFTATVTVQYQVPGPPVLDQVTRYYVPDWSNTVSKPVPFVWVEVQNPSGQVIQHAYADANGIATLSGLDPAVVYTPVVRSKVIESTLGLDFQVLNNTAPVDTTQPSYRARYASYANPGSAFTPGTRLTQQSMGTLTAGDGWDATQKLLVDANRAAAPYALLANAVYEAQIVSAAVGGTPTWRPLTILWSTKNKGGLALPPVNMDQGFSTSSAYYNRNGHSGVDPQGKETLSSVAEDAVFISGDQTTEPMDIYPFALAHEMGHFTQSLFSANYSPGGAHSASDYEDPLLAWGEGSASGIAALVLQTPKQYRLGNVSGQLVVGIEDPSTYTVNGTAQSWPLGWFQEETVTRLMWQLYDPAGTIKLSAQAVLAPMFSATWRAGPWLSTPWAYSVQLAKLNAANATAINTLADSVNIKTTGNDEWGSTETNPGNRSAQDALPPYITVPIGGGPISICSAGAPNDYNKTSNVRYFRIPGDGNSHTLTAQGAAGTVPLLARFGYTAGSRTTTLSGSIPVGQTVLSVGDCSVALSRFSTSTAACTEPATPAAEQCWTVTVP